jgi:hypothetical protein
MLWEYRLENIFIPESGQYWFINNELTKISDNKTQIPNKFLSTPCVTVTLNFRIGLEHDTWYSVHIPIYVQQDTTLHSLFYLETALHVSGDTSIHYQERIQLYLQHLVFVAPLLLPAAIACNDTVCNAACSIAHSIICTRLFRGKMHSDWFNGIEILQGRWQHGEKVGYCYPSGLETTLCERDIYVPLVGHICPAGHERTK